MTGSRPGLLRGRLACRAGRARRAASSPGLYLFSPDPPADPGRSLVAVGLPRHAAPGHARAASPSAAMNPLATCVCLLLMFYTVESLERERSTRLAAISHADPDPHRLAPPGQGARAGARSALAIVAGRRAGGADRHPDPGPGAPRAPPVPPGLGAPAVARPSCSGPCFVMAVQALTRNRYATYAVGLARDRLHGLSPVHRTRSTGWATGRSGARCAGATSACSSSTAGPWSSAASWPVGLAVFLLARRGPVFRPPRGRRRPGSSTGFGPGRC